MNLMQRQVYKLRNKGPGDNQKMSVVISDYEDVDRLLAKLVDSFTAWRESWIDIVRHQLQTVFEFDSLYDPIVGTTDGYSRNPAPTPELQLHRTCTLRAEYGQLKNEIMEEVSLIEARVIIPATGVRDSLGPVRKTIKKRENKRLDYERCQDKVLKLQRKGDRASRVEATPAKAEMELARLSDEFDAIDEHIRMTLPPLVKASFKIVPHLLREHVLIQNRLLGMWYTTVHGYCEQFGIASPPGPLDEVVACWDASFKPVQGQVESLSFIARGKAAHQPMHMKGHDAHAVKPPQEARRTPSGLIPNGAQRSLRAQSPQSHKASSPEPSPVSSSPLPGPRLDYLTPTAFTTATILGGGMVESSNDTRSPAAIGINGMLTPSAIRAAQQQQQQRDYFSSASSSRNGSVSGVCGLSDRVSTTSTVASSVSAYSNNINNNTNGGLHAAVIAKKKHPPPPPPKRIVSIGKPPDEFVVALYSFRGEGQGDLAFGEGDRIRIVKKTEKEQDWWVGELNGVQGNFPRNYCRVG